MRVVVVGATGNLGTSVLRSLEKEESVESVLGLARRLPGLSIPKVEWTSADVVGDDLVPHFMGADAVVLLAWLIQPSRDLTKQWMVNVEGSTWVARAVKEAGVPSLLYASSVGAYSPGPKDRRVDESWPTGGTPTSYYGRHKAEVERRLDRFEAEAPGVRLVRMRPGLVFKKEAAVGIRRLFAGPFFPSVLANPALINVIPDIEDLRSQVVHSYDVGEAFRLGIVNEKASGAFNLAAEPVLDAGEIGRILNARPVPMPAGIARAGAGLSWALRLQPVPPGWLDLSRNVPIMDTTRARTELGWIPQYSADEALLDLLEGLRTGSGLDTPPLSPKTGGRFRIREILTGVGGREP
ncbi:MAG: NAD-dependent epimerase/dehydratase family protein [Rubrobacter sp.]|jgi:nucleoside-diphosphate-sugar epimerase|nr:NAD-dependent epimerase/dehydratase family protein [Rubrobacteraceae bacterium]MBA3614880.1 NAD-dependent epimerase/dehydratase family protein [Rubrobacteraceae bacterium]MDQ3437802.1 NAD-dependent epimerase/dehydratase family protein [Actinomycetota bacterium]